MNTLVDPNDGAQAPETKDEVASSTPGDPAAVARPSDATLIELAPASGQTLILPHGPAQELRQALASGGPVAPTPTRTAAAPAAAPAGAGRSRRLLAGARALAAPRPQDRARLRRLAPFAVGVVSLVATAIPLWSRSPPSSPHGGAVIPTLGGAGAAPAAVAPPAAEAASPAPTAPPVAVPAPVDPARETAEPEARPADHTHAGTARALVDHRRRTRGALASPWKGRALVLRTRNGAPVVD
jgi:hypothetical protein